MVGNLVLVGIGGCFPMDWLFTLETVWTAAWLVVGMARGGLCFFEGKVLVGIGENLCSLMDWFCLWLGGKWCVVGSKKWCL